MNDTQLLAGQPLFQGIGLEELPLMLNCLNAVEKTYSRGEMIFDAGERADRVGLLLAGSVQLARYEYGGQRTLFAQVAAGDIFGEAFACAEPPVFEVAAQAAEESRVLFVDYRRIVTVCPSACVFHSRLVRNLLAILAGKNITLSRKLVHLAKRSTREKLLSYLAEQAALAGRSSFSIPFDRQELADYLCVERSAMSRELGKLREEGVISFQRSRFTLREPCGK